MKKYFLVEFTPTGVNLVGEFDYKNQAEVIQEERPGSKIFTALYLAKYAKRHPDTKFNFEVPAVRDHRGNNPGKGRKRAEPGMKRVRYQGNILLPEWMGNKLKSLAKKKGISAGRLTEMALVEKFKFRKDENQ